MSVKLPDWRSIAVRAIEQNVYMADIIIDIMRKAGVPENHENLNKIKEVRGKFNHLLIESEGKGT